MQCLADFNVSALQRVSTDANRIVSFVVLPSLSTCLAVLRTKYHLPAHCSRSNVPVTAYHPLPMSHSLSPLLSQVQCVSLPRLHWPSVQTMVMDLGQNHFILHYVTSCYVTLYYTIVYYIILYSLSLKLDCKLPRRPYDFREQSELVWFGSSLFGPRQAHSLFKHIAF